MKKVIGHTTLGNIVTVNFQDGNMVMMDRSRNLKMLKGNYAYIEAAKEYLGEL